MGLVTQLMLMRVTYAPPNPSASLFTASLN